MNEDKLLAAIRVVNAKVEDYMMSPFPEDIEDLKTEISELGDEIMAILNPIVEEYDDIGEV